MIRLLEPGREDAFAQACAFTPVTGARVWSLLECYGTNHRDIQIWLGEDGSGTPYAALSRHDGWLDLSAAPECPIEELSAFVQAAGGFHSLEAAPAICRKLLPGWRYSSAPVMEYRHATLPAHSAGVQPPPSLEAVYRLLCRVTPSLEAEAPFPGWYTHTSHLARHGLGYTAVILENGSPVAAGSVTAIGPGHAVIGSIATLPAFRSKGYGSAVTNHLARWAINRGKTPILCCAEPSLAEYYQRLGFSPAGAWAHRTRSN